MKKKEIGKILFVSGIFIWVGTHIYILVNGGMPQDAVIKHAWINIIAFIVYAIGYMNLNLKL